jgi:transmembrane sensor
MHTEERFQQLLDSYLAGTCTPAEKRLIEAWFEKGGDVSKPDLLLSRAAQARLLKRIHQQQPKRIFLLRYPQLAAAVCIGLLITIGFWKVRHPATPSLVTVQTGTGEVKQLALPDGSVVWINANTTMSYRPDFATHREIRLSGEAMFQVATDQQHPFTVQSQDSVYTKVLGTVFNVRSYAATSVTVFSGKVQVSAKGVTGILTQQQSIRYDRGHLISSAAIETAAWTKGEWDYNDLSVSDLALLLKNQYNVTVHGKTTLHTGVSVNFNRRQSAEDIISTFCALANCRYKKGNGQTFEIY